MPEKQSQLSVAKEEFNQYVRKSLEAAMALRDQMKVQAQLGTVEAKALWGDLEKYLGHLDNLAHDLNHAAGEFGDRLLALVRRATPKRTAKRAVKRVTKVAKRAAKKAPAKRAPAKKAPKTRTRR